MAHIVEVAALGGDDEGETVKITLNVDAMLWAEDVEGRALVEFVGGSNRLLAISRDDFTELVRLSRLRDKVR